MIVSGKGCFIVGKKIESKCKKNAIITANPLLFNAFVSILKKRYENKSYLCEVKS